MAAEGLKLLRQYIPHQAMEEACDQTDAESVQGSANPNPVKKKKNQSQSVLD